MAKSLKDLQIETKEIVEKFNFNWSLYVQYVHLVEEIALDRYISTTKDANEWLVRAIFGWLDPKNIVQPILLGKLDHAYHHGDKFSLDNVFKEVEDDIVYKIKRGGLAMSPLKVKLLYDVLETLDLREKDVLFGYFGLNREPLTLEEIGKQYNLGRERIRQIKERALRRLRHPSRSEKTQILAGLATDEDVELYQIKLRNTIKEDVAKKQFLNNLKMEDIFKTHIDELKLSVRSYNCLRAANLFSIGDIIKKTPEELLKHRNMGRKSIRDIQSALSKFSVSLKHYNPEF